MGIKYYRKRGTKEITHRSEHTDHISFIPKEPPVKYFAIHRQGKEEFKQFLEDHDFEEVTNYSIIKNYLMSDEAKKYRVLKGILAQETKQENPITSLDNEARIKLPEVGKRYKQIGRHNSWSGFKIAKIENGIVYHEDGIGRTDIDYFFKLYEELPNQEEIKEPLKFKRRGEWTPLPSGIEFGTPEFERWFKKEFKIDPDFGSDIPKEKHIYISDGFESYVPESNDRVEKAKEELREAIIKINTGYLAKSDEKAFEEYEELERKAQNLLDVLEETKQKGCTESENKYFQLGWKAALDFTKNKSGEKTKEPEKPMYEHITVGVRKDLSIGVIDKDNPEVDLDEVCEPKSIWKDVSELPEYACDVFVIDEEKYFHVGYYNPSEREFYLARAGEKITRFINKYCTLTDYINDDQAFKSEMREKMNVDIDKLKKARRIISNNTIGDPNLTINAIDLIIEVLLEGK